MALGIQGPRFGPLEIEGGPACALSISEPDESPFWWVLTVEARGEDWMRLGILRTLPMAGPRAVGYPNASSARAIACAYMPGAKGYRVSGVAFGPEGSAPADARAELAITVGPPSGWQRPGLSRVNAWEDGAEYQRPPETSEIIVAPGPAVQIAPADPFRTRLVISNGSIAMGPNPPRISGDPGFAYPDGFALLGDFETTSHRAIYCATLGIGSTITTWREGP